MTDVVVNLTGNVSANASVEDFLLQQLGPRSKDIVSAVVLTIVYSLIFLSGSLGNICTCIVIVSNHCMRTTTNYYLFSLAVSDLLLLFFGECHRRLYLWRSCCVLYALRARQVRGTVGSLGLLLSRPLLFVSRLLSANISLC